MLLYAWQLPQFRGADNLAFEDSPDLVNLLARVVLDRTKAELRRGLHRDYRVREERLTRLRGRVDLLGSARRLELLHGSATCRYDELTEDILPNQILKSSLLHLAAADRLASHLRRDLRIVATRMGSVTVLPWVSEEQFGRVTVARNNATYRLLMSVCRLVWSLQLPTESAGLDPFAGLLEDELRMSQVFEHFVRNFFRLRLRSFDVTSEQLEWPAEGNRQHLPGMRTDVTLMSPTRRIVIDTKYYREALLEHHGKNLARSSNLYQMFAYLRTQESRRGPFGEAEGMLLYPTVGYALDERYQIQGHAIRLVTLDLGAPWQEIEHHLMNLVVDSAAAGEPQAREHPPPPGRPNGMAVPR